MNSFFEELYEKYHQDVFRFLFYMVKNRETAEDLVQEVYIRVLKSYSKFQGNSSEKTWLFSIARNVAIDWFRKQKNWKQRFNDKFDWIEQQIKDDQPFPEEITLQKEEVRHIMRCLNECTFNQRMVIIMRYFNELSISETAEALNWTESKVKISQHRALKALRVSLQEMMVEEGITVEKV
jgi:RNA polymerase sigma-70 factor (ECF subfamily)